MMSLTLITEPVLSSTFKLPSQFSVGEHVSACSIFLAIEYALALRFLIYLKVATMFGTTCTGSFLQQRDYMAREHKSASLERVLTMCFSFCSLMVTSFEKMSSTLTCPRSLRDFGALRRYIQIHISSLSKSCTL